MKNFWTIILILSCLTLFSSGDVFAKKNEPKGDKVRAVSRLNHSGDIKGTVLCSKGSVDGTVVYISGHSFMVKPDSKGEFTIYNVPTGEYNIVIEKLNQKIYDGSVVVIKKRVTDLGDIPIDCGEDYDDDCGENCDEELN